jgi:alkanesulfonate monooxygenase SsuD/methylene tetrahydromethanopterin reductase-like flavin-dependent oxidoreductase (luciferase family)
MPDNPADDDFLAALENGTLPLAAFDHRAHVRAGYLYVTRHGFGGAIERFGAALRRFAAANGKDGLYHETITVAFLALINEHVAASDAQDWESFIAGNPELLDRSTLLHFYAPEELASAEARRVFKLPRTRVA